MNTNTSLAQKILDEKKQNFKHGLYHYTQIKLAYNSNHIEGSRLTEEQTRYIYETHSICTGDDAAADIDDIMETVNHFKCFDYILDNYDVPVNEDMIKHIHFMLKTNTAAEQLSWFRIGDYKLRPNYIGDTKTSPPNRVGADINMLLDRYNALSDISFNDIVEFHYQFESIHPFQDGNGRVGRLLMFKECLRNNVTPFIIDDEHKLFYYRGLKEFKTEPGYLVDTCLLCQDNYTAAIDYFYPPSSPQININQNHKHR